MIKWNTGRTYTKDGQRMAAKQMEDGVFVVDIDRGISFFLPDGELNQSYIMCAYDLNAHESYPASYVKWGTEQWVAFNETRATLEKYAA